MIYPVCVGGKCGFIDSTGAVVVELRYEDTRGFREDLAGVKEGEKWGFIDSAGQMVIRPQFDSCRSFSSGLALVQIGGRKYYIDTLGERVIQADFHYAYDFQGDLAKVQRDVMCHGAFIDRTGNVVLCERMYIASEYRDGLINFQELSGGPKSWGYVTRDDVVAIPAQFRNAHAFSEGLAAVSLRNDREFVFIDTSGCGVITRVYNGATLKFSEGRCAVWDKAFGYIDRAGELVIGYGYYFAEHFSSGLAIVSEKRNGKYGYIDRDGTIVIKPRFQIADSFQGEVASVVVGDGRDDDYCSYINRSGDFVWRPD